MSRWNKLFVMTAVCCVLSACTGKPPLEKREHDPEIVSIAYLKSLYTVAPHTVSTDISIEGYVVANDRWGNFWKTIVVADQTGGIEVKLDAEELYLVYKAGDKIHVNCNSLTIGDYGGVVQLGASSGDVRYETDYIPRNLIHSVVAIIPDAAVEQLPARMTIPEIEASGARYLDCYVEIPDVQFLTVGAGATWSEAEADTDRELVDGNGNKMVVRTSCMATFATDMLPVGSGTMRAILSYFNGKYQLRVFDHRSVDMEQERF